MFLIGTRFDVNAQMRINLQAHLDQCKLDFPAVLDLHQTVQDPGLTDGPSIASAYTLEGAHPSTTGYTRLFSEPQGFNAQFPVALSSAIAADGFQEA